MAFYKRKIERKFFLAIFVCSEWISMFICQQNLEINWILIFLLNILRITTDHILKDGSFFFHDIPMNHVKPIVESFVERIAVQLISTNIDSYTEWALLLAFCHNTMVMLLFQVLPLDHSVFVQLFLSQWLKHN